MARDIRLTKELKKIQQNAENSKLIIDAKSSDLWYITFDGPIGSLYEGETYTLQFCFDSNYPIQPPVVTFINTPPVHKHIYSNGHICLNILSDDWSPALTSEAVTLSIISMLASATEKVPPENDKSYSRRSTNPRSSRFVFDDDTV